MNASINDKVQKNIVQLCQIVPQHVQSWKSAIQESANRTEALCNLADQLRHVEKAHISAMNDFENVQKALQFCILTGIEEELAVIRHQREKMGKANQIVKNKLVTLEKSTVDLDWTEENPLITGNATQPSLTILLGGGLDYLAYFNHAYKRLSDALRDMDLHCEESMSSFEKAFKVNLNCIEVQWLLSVTQYVTKGIK